jgi:hypothetical protein
MAAALCYGVRGGGAQLCFHLTPGNYDTDTPHPGPGRAATVPGRGEGHAAVGRPARPPQLRHAGLAEHPAVLAGGGTPARLRARPEPGGGLWSSLKAVELANLTSPTLAEVIDQAHRGIERVRRTPHLAYSFLRRTGLSVS